MKNIVRVWIGDPYDKGHFNGTAFFIDEHTLVTAKHVVLNSQNEIYQDIYLTNTPDGGVTPIDDVVLCKRDMVVLKVKKAFNIEAVSFSDELSVGENVNVVGFYDNSSSQKSYSNRVSGYQNGEHTYELQNHLTHGLSGSPVFLNGDICGVTKAINSTKNITYVIPISELCVELQESKKEDNEPHEVFDDAPFTGLTDKALVRILKLQDKIDELETKLKTSNKPEEQLELSALLDEVRKEKDKKDMEIKSLNEFIENSNLKVVRKATEISEEKGLEATLEYFNGKKFTKFEKNIQSNMKELAGGYLFQAKALQLDNRYDEAKEAYKNILTYDRSVDTLFDYAQFLQGQNYFSEAIEVYEQLLPEQRALAKTDPRNYNRYVARTLNRLANLYSSRNELQKAEEAYDEALEIRRALTKTDPRKYNPEVAMILNNLGLLYASKNQIKKAKEAYDEALKLNRALAKTNPGEYNPDVAMILNNLGLLYGSKNQVQKAEEAFSEALKLNRAFAKADPSVYNRYVARTLNRLGNLYSARNQLQKAEKVYVEALELYKFLAKTNPNVYNPYVAVILNNLVLLYSNKNQIKKAKEAFSKALELYKALARTNPSIYGIGLADSLVMGVDLLNQPSKNLDEAEAILQQFKGNYRAKHLLDIIKKLRKQ